MLRDFAPARQARMAMQQHQQVVEAVVNDLCFPSSLGSTTPVDPPHHRHRKRPPHTSNPCHASSYIPVNTSLVWGPPAVAPQSPRNHAQKPHEQAQATITPQHVGARNLVIDQGIWGAPPIGRTSSGVSATSRKGTPTTSPNYDSLRSHSYRKRLWTTKSNDVSPLAASLHQQLVRRENVSRASSGGTLHPAASGARKHAPNFPGDGSRERGAAPPRSQSEEPLSPELRTQSAPGPLSQPRRHLPADQLQRGGSDAPAPLEPFSRVRTLPVEPTRAPSNRQLQHVAPQPSTLKPQH